MVLRPYFANVGKRLFRTPKVSFIHVGTSCYVAGLKAPSHAAPVPTCGAITETALLSEIIKALTHRIGKRGTVIQPDPNKVRITIRLDADIVEYFKEQVHKAGGGIYQTMINSALRQYLDKKQEPMDEETLRRVIR